MSLRAAFGNVLGNLSVGSLQGGQIAGFRNKLINGAFDIWQRGTSFSAITSTLTYTADRWYAVGNASASITVARQTTPAATFSFSSRVQRANANADTHAIHYVQIIQSANAVPLQGKTVSISFQGKCGANYSSAASALSVVVATGTGTDEGASSYNAGTWTGVASAISGTATLTTSYQSFQFNATLAAGATEIAIDFSFTPVGTASTNDWFEITGVQLEISPNSTPFETLNFSQNVELCLPYYRKSFPYATAPAQTGGVTGAISIKNPIALGDPSYYVQFIPPMRATPTITTYNPSAGNANWRNITQSADVTVSVDPATTLGMGGVLIATSGTVTTLGDVLGIHYQAVAEL